MGKKTTILVIAVVLGVLAVFGSARADLTDGLVAHWKFDEGSGDTAYDSAGGNNGFIYGAQWADGALDFDGNDDYVDIPYDSSLDIDAGGGITISAYIKLRSYPDMTQGPIFGLYESKVEGTKNYLLIHKSFYGNYLSLDQFPPSFGWIDSITPALDTWYHVVAVQDSSYRAIYIDGNLYSSDNSPEIYAGGTADTIRIGNRADGLASYYFDGMIDDVRIYDRVLSAEEAEELYRGELVGLEIVGPNEVAEDFSAQYKAMAHYDNGGTVDVTALADWWIDDETVASINAGLLTTEAIDLPQDIIITAEYSEGENIQEAKKEVSIFAICPTGSALDFDGVDDYVGLPDNEPFWLPQDNFTLSLWVYFERSLSDLTKNEKLLDLNHGESADPANELGYGIMRLKTGEVWFRLTTITNTDEDLATDDILYKDRWYHIAAIRNGTSQEVYINGQLSKSRTCSPDPVKFFGGYDDDKVSIGRSTNFGTPGLHLKGLIDEVGIYNRALSGEEIQVLMHTRPEGDDPNLIGYWDFDEGEGQVAGDLSVYGNDGQLGSGPDEDESDPGWVESDAPVGICSTPVALDIKPCSCPNPLNLRSQGVLPVAVLGSEDFDVSMIDIASICLEDVAAIRHSYEDVAAPVANADECECTEDGPDGYVDLTLKFKTQEIVDKLISDPGDLEKGQVLVLTLTGKLSDNTPIEGSDCIVLVGNVPRHLLAR